MQKNAENIKKQCFFVSFPKLLYIFGEGGIFVVHNMAKFLSIFYLYFLKFFKGQFWSKIHPTKQILNSTGNIVVAVKLET